MALSGSDHYTAAHGLAMDIAADAFRPLPLYMRAMPRVVLWGGREGDIQFGSPEYHAWAESRGPIRPRFLWEGGLFDGGGGSHLHIARGL